MNALLAAPNLSPAPGAVSTKPLWAAVGVLSVCVISMGATLVHVNKRVEPLAQASIPLASSYAMNAPAASQAMITEETLKEKPSVAPAKSAQNATQPIAKQASPAIAQALGSPPTAQPSSQAPPAIICKSCGTVEAVTPITKTPPGSGVGVIAGGVLGGVVGNQIGKGNGRTAATVLGALGGGWAGNAVEKNMKKTTVYAVRIRMADGSLRTLEQSSSPMVGSKVTLDGNSMRPA